MAQSRDEPHAGDDARKAYTDALTHLDANAANRAFVQMKLDDLTGAEKKGS